MHNVDAIQNTPMKEKVRKEYYVRVTLILKTEMNKKTRK